MFVAPLPLSLFGSGDVGLNPSAEFRRHQLDPCCWVDTVDGLITGANSLFGTVEAEFDWFRGQRLMYGTWHREPRLTAQLDLADPVVPSVIRDAAELLSRHYGRTFEGLFCNYYQSGRDSVAWHADRIGRTAVDPLVAIISLGGPRTFSVRDQSRNSATARWVMQSGDLLVMGGATQHHWEHAICKTADAPPRISLTIRAGFRPDRGLEP